MRVRVRVRVLEMLGFRVSYWSITAVGGRSWLAALGLTTTLLPSLLPSARSDAHPPTAAHHAHLPTAAHHAHHASKVCNFNYKVRPDGEVALFEVNTRVGGDLAVDVPRWRARVFFEKLDRYAKCS